MAITEKSPLIVALYLPQFYETEYNNKWWGKGYTEWTALKKASPLFDGHYQPRIPLDNNYYDLSQRDSIKQQVDLAKEYGVDGFAIYQYYSCGKKLLEVPTEIIRDDPSLDIPFFLFWANESWRKAWFGQDSSVVWEQEYGEEKEWRQQYEYCSSFFSDERYIKIDGKPVYAIYNAWDLPDVDHFIERWNQWARDDGFAGIFFVKAVGRRDRKERGAFSATVTREPNYTFAHDELLVEKIARVAKSRTVNFINKTILLKKGKGIVMTKASYDLIWERIIKRPIVDNNVFLGAFCDWDNSPRKSYNSIIMKGATPEKFGLYFGQLYRKAIDNSVPMIVINAWNEWAEGAYLEPDERCRFAYLEAIRNVKDRHKNGSDE